MVSVLEIMWLERTTLLQRMERADNTTRELINTRCDLFHILIRTPVPPDSTTMERETISSLKSVASVQAHLLSQVLGIPHAPKFYEI
jgi:hypothetical protein